MGLVSPKKKTTKKNQRTARTLEVPARNPPTGSFTGFQPPEGKAETDPKGNEKVVFPSHRKLFFGGILTVKLPGGKFCGGNPNFRKSVDTHFSGLKFPGRSPEIRSQEMIQP